MKNLLLTFYKKDIVFLLLIFGVIFSGFFYFNIFSALGEAEEVPFDSHISRTECYGGTAYFYTDVPSFYSGSKVSLEAKPSSNPAGCADLGINLCNWGSGCQVAATPGQRLNFEVSVSCGYCGDYGNKYWYVYAKAITGPVCGNGSCESGETCSSCSADCGVCKKSDGSSCSSASECSGGYCVHTKCRSSSIYCGDTYCDSGETCSSCSSDCGSCEKSDGSSCSYNSECAGGYCVHGKCRSHGYYWGDGFCDYSLGEECSSSDCTSYSSCAAAEGSYCSTAADCPQMYCVHNKCRPNYTYCGDGYCDKDYGYGESCSNCSKDCGSCGPVCGNGSCESGESCSNCSSDCGACQSTKKPDEAPCSASSECQSGYCALGMCISASYCGNGTCDPWEDCSFCSRDCPVCTTKKYGESCSIDKECLSNYCHSTKKICCNASAYGCCRQASECGDISRFICENFTCILQQKTETGVKKADGEYCDKSEECKSGNCRNYRCCLKGKTCCLSTNNCQSGYYCSEDKHYCLPGKPDGQLCAKDEICKSGNCENGICCAWGQKCCQKHGDCGNKEYCDDQINYCRYRLALGEKCGQAAMCNSGYCDSATWTCAEKPPETAAPSATPPSMVEQNVSPVPQAEANVILINLPPSIALKKGEKWNVPLAIWNKGQKEVILAEAIEIDNQIPFIVDSGLKATLRVPAKKIKLLPGDIVTSASSDILEALESLTLTGKSAGSGEIKLKAIYFFDGRAKIIEGKIPVAVSSEHTDKEPTASNLFGQQMIFVASQTTHETITNTSTPKKEVIFVEPEYQAPYQTVTNSWEKARLQKEEALQNLKDDFIGTVKPEILSFFETIEQLNQAKSQQEITAATLRAIAPPTMIAGFDLANLIDAIDKMQKEEKTFLNHFGAKEFKIKDLPLYDERGNFIGNSRAVIKEEGDKIYAMKIGDL